MHFINERKLPLILSLTDISHQLFPDNVKSEQFLGTVRSKIAVINLMFEHVSEVT
jgi:hypothetical protein